MEHLREALHTLVTEQQELYQKAAHSALSLSRLSQRIIIMERYFLAVVRKGVLPEQEEVQGVEPEEVENEAVEEEREGGGVAKPELPESGKKEKRKFNLVVMDKLEGMADSITRYMQSDAG